MGPTLSLSIHRNTVTQILRSYWVSPGTKERVAVGGRRPFLSCPSRPTREQLIALAKRDPEAIADLVLSLWSRVESLLAKVAELQRASRTSSKPPSSDQGNFANPPKPNPTSLRRKSGRKSGGTLQQSGTPDPIEEHRLDSAVVCPRCGGPLEISPPGEPLHPQDCEGTVNRIMARSSGIVIQGFAINPEPPPPPPGTRGRVKRGKALNGLHRLDTRPCGIMGFLTLAEATHPLPGQARRVARHFKSDLSGYQE